MLEVFVGAAIGIALFLLLYTAFHIGARLAEAAFHEWMRGLD